LCVSLSGISPRGFNDRLVIDETRAASGSS
jgi:hypothetical protein